MVANERANESAYQIRLVKSTGRTSIGYLFHQAARPPGRKTKLPTGWGQTGVPMPPAFLETPFIRRLLTINKGCGSKSQGYLKILDRKVKCSQTPCSQAGVDASLVCGGGKIAEHKDPGRENPPTPNLSMPLINCHQFTLGAGRSQ